MATRMTENGVSTCRKAGSEQFEKFQTGFGRRKRTLVQYDYRAYDGGSDFGGMPPQVQWMVIGKRKEAQR